jgi:hypothetical protein
MTDDWQKSRLALYFTYENIVRTKPPERLRIRIGAQVFLVDAGGLSFAALVETFKRCRNSGEHNVVVQHMSIAEGGQAIVGNLTRSARKSKPQKAAKKMAALIDGRQPAAEIIQESTRAKVPLRRFASCPNPEK